MNDTAINPIILETGWTLVHFTWQAAVLGIIHKLLLKQAWANTPSRRYRISLTTLLLLVALPLVTAWQLEPANSPGNTATQLALPPVDGTEVSIHAASIDTTAAPSLEARIMPWLVGTWLLGVVVYALRFLLGFIGLRRIIRHSSSATLPGWLLRELDELRQALGIAQRVRLATSTIIESPMVTGWLLPTILLPVCATTRLTPAQLRMTLVHELAHVQRHDYLVNFLQVMVETLFFFHPVAHQVSRNLRVEREKCCDDVVTMHCGNRLGYARLLTELELLRQPPAAAWTMGMAGGIAQGELTSRVQRIVGVAEHVSPPRMNWPMLVPLLLIAVLLGLRTSMPDTANRVRHGIALPAERPTTLPAPITASDSEAMEPRVLAGKAGDIPPVAAVKTTSPNRSRTPAKSTSKYREPAASTADAPAATVDSAGRESSDADTTPALAGSEGDEHKPTSQEASRSTPAGTEEDLTGGRLLSVVQPEYPRYALQHGVVGNVTVEFTVDTNGRTRNIKVIAAEPRRVFDSAAIEAIREWRFEPFKMNGQAVAQDVRQTLDFSPIHGDTDDGLQRDCNTLTGSRLCRSDPVSGANVVTYTGDTTVGY